MHHDSRAGLLAELVAERDLERLGTYLTDDVRLRALLPGGPIEKHGREDVLAAFDTWFGTFPTVALEEVVGDLVGDRLLVHYRLAFDSEAPRRVLTQTWVASVGEDDGIFRIDLLCSGFREAR